MTGRLYITDGTVDRDVYANYGVYIEYGGYNDLVAMPPLKTPTYNDWHEEDGIEVDLSDPKLDTQSVTIKFVANAGQTKMEQFFAVLYDGAYHTFKCVSIGRTYKLRVVSVGAYTIVGGLYKFSVKFANDYPLQDYRYSLPSSSLPTDNEWKIDKTPLTNYGCRILKGTLAEVVKRWDVKQNMLRNIKTSTGAIYDGKKVTLKSREVTLDCLFTASSLTELWRNYDALLYDLRRGGTHYLNVASLNRNYPFYYKSCKVPKFEPQGKIWLQCTITLVFI